MSAIELDDCVKSRLESLDYVLEGAGFNCSNLAGDCFLQSINCLWVATINFVFEVSPEKEVTGVQVWAVWRPVHSPTVLGWVAQSNDAAGEVLIENLKHIVGPVRESTILHEPVEINGVQSLCKRNEPFQEQLFVPLAVDILVNEDWTKYALLAYCTPHCDTLGLHRRCLEDSGIVASPEPIVLLVDIPGQPEVSLVREPDPPCPDCPVEDPADHQLRKLETPFHIEIREFLEHLDLIRIKIELCFDNPVE